MTLRSTILLLTVFLMLGGCGAGLSSVARPGLAKNANHPGSTLRTDFDGNTEMTAATVAPIPQVDFDSATMAARGVPGDGLRLGPDGIVVFNALSRVSFKGATIEFSDDGAVTRVLIDEYGGDRDALFASMSAQTSLIIDLAKQLSADQREKFFRAAALAETFTVEAIAAARAYFTAGASELVPDAPAPDEGGDA